MALIVINCPFVVTGDEDSDPERSPLTPSDHLLGWPLVTTCGVFASSYCTGLRIERTVLGGKGRDGKAKGEPDENTEKKRVDLRQKQKGRHDLMNYKYLVTYPLPCQGPIANDAAKYSSKDWS